MLAQRPGRIRWRRSRSCGSCGEDLFRRIDTDITVRLEICQVLDISGKERILQERICVSGFHLQSRSDRLGDFIRKCQLCTGQIVYAAGEYESADRTIIIPKVEKPQRAHRRWRETFPETEAGRSSGRYVSHRGKKEKDWKRYMDKDPFRLDLCTERKDNLCEIVTCQCCPDSVPDYGYQSE